MADVRRRDFTKGVLALVVGGKELLSQQTNSVVKAPDAAIPSAPVPVMQGLAGLKPPPMQLLVPDAVADTAKHFFTPVEMATLTRLSDLLHPPLKGKPGAIQANAPQFLDFLIGASPADRQRIYRTGLATLESQAHAHFTTPFAKLTAAQADTLIRPWLRTWMTDHPPTEGMAAFINAARIDIGTATLNSKAWHDAGNTNPKKVEGGLYWLPIEPAMITKSKRVQA